ncbi:hypothetical protein CVT24_008347 [Panaeolus cyanescens]|uniref:Zn(2)-C6 fungal-type domain-containing protein n=1 Tax=Panaeolus cyanescens TaxID=181874 RepID=A0A409VEP3_9AGAR|nr:hypothetical protein CVT24_008347 [Panaeolus cyanescens]
MSASPPKVAHKDIKRIAMACKNCRTRKLKCRPFDKTLNTGDCERCVEARTECIYEPIQKAHEPSSSPNNIPSIVPVIHPHNKSVPQPQLAAAVPPQTLSSMTPERASAAPFYPQIPSAPGNWNQQVQRPYPVRPAPQPEVPHGQYPIHQTTTGVYQHSYPAHTPVAQYPPPLTSQHLQHFQQPQQPIAQHNAPMLAFPNHMNPQQEPALAGQTPYIAYQSHLGITPQPTMINAPVEETFGYPVSHPTHAYGLVSQESSLYVNSLFEARPISYLFQGAVAISDDRWER